MKGYYNQHCFINRHTYFLDMYVSFEHKIRIRTERHYMRWNSQNIYYDVRKDSHYSITE